MLAYAQVIEPNDAGASTGRILDPVLIGALSHRSDGQGVLRLATHAGCICSTGLLVWLALSSWLLLVPAMVLHGRYTCTASNPKCPSCVLEDVCEKRGVDGSSEEEEADMPAPKKPAKSKATAAKKPAAVVARSETGHNAGGAPFDVDAIPASWKAVIGGEFDKSYFKELEAFVRQERAQHEVFPPAGDVFNALKYTPYDEMKVLLLGQDPYHDNGQAHHSRWD